MVRNGVRKWTRRYLPKCRRKSFAENRWSRMVCENGCHYDVIRGNGCNEDFVGPTSGDDLRTEGWTVLAGAWYDSVELHRVFRARGMGFWRAREIVVGCTLTTALGCTEISGLTASGVGACEKSMSVFIVAGFER